MVEKLPEGTEVLVALQWEGFPAGATFMVQGAGNSEGAFCVAMGGSGTRLFLHEITMVGGAADPDELRFTNFTFSTPMPPGTKFEIIGLASPFTYCGGGYPIYRAVVVNGPGN